ncbi:MAG TPA: NAD-binding protein, partial [Mycobacteriales bacterium]|nr:NAD-binding protein [Mycobacteriales bacterium]
LARRLGVPLIIGDIRDDATLRVASTATARAVLAVTSDDITNLQAGLAARALRKDLSIVLRLFDGEFAARVQKSADMLVSSRSVSYLAAPSFAVAMLERQVIDTIAVGRHVLLVAEIPVVVGSKLEGMCLTELEATGEVRLLATFPPNSNQGQFDLPPDHCFIASEQLIVVATKAGLGRLVEGSFPTGP